MTQADDDYGFPPSESLGDTISETPTSPPSTPRKKRRRRKKGEVQVDPRGFPVWFEKPRNQAIAEWLAFNTWLDKSLGIEPSPDLYPYNEHRRTVVVQFLHRLGVPCAEAPPITS